ncbi:TonB-dependent receptor plug domain-containing protein [Janthinobacterium sp. PC23-8]|uniref:TonB-dependent receptor plug domain-containing protein n=1 Tax=Janthinobacterium sp. PC23-8 TaxID=2012679 RepID=UPI000B97BE20|nr:TonB-dependent receptor plug domain-containing protein [Janthinobacterium sp. PC23-8]OYO28042.1 hypothetical protein CD932_23405 [Janthinobacterium sp. PC23-8]
MISASCPTSISWKRRAAFQACRWWAAATPPRTATSTRCATIRGLDSRYNLVTVDGVPIASSDQTYRGARLEMLPAGLVSQIQAIKTVTAEYDPHALGGQVNLVSRSAFARDQDRFFVANAFAGCNSSAGKFLSDKKNSGRADATGAAIFGDRRQFGIVVSAELQRLPSSAFSELPGDTTGAGWTYYTASGQQAPVRNQDYAFDNLRERASLNTKLEYRFGERSYLSAFAGHYADKDTETRYETLTSPGSAMVPTASGGRFALGDVQQGFTYQPVKRRTRLLTLDSLFEAGANADVGVTASSSRATYREYRQMIKYDTNPRAGTTTAQYLPGLAYSTTLELRFRAARNGVKRVVLESGDLRFTTTDDIVTVSLPPVASDAVTAGEFATHIVEPGMVLRFEHADIARRAGAYAHGAFPVRQRRAADNLQFAQREVIRRTGLCDYVAQEKLGAIQAMGFDTNFPHGHADAPPHMHMHLRWPLNAGTQIGHYYIDEAGLLTHNVVGVKSMDCQGRTYQRGELFTTMDVRGRAIYQHRITQEGWLELGRAGAARCLIKPAQAGKGFDTGASVACPTQRPVTISVTDDLDAGIMRVATGQVAETFRYDTETGKLLSDVAPPAPSESIYVPLEQKPRFIYSLSPLAIWPNTSSRRTQA